MTTEEKAKAYDDALERAKNLYNEAKANDFASDMEDYETIFPELKGLINDENERIRKELIEFLCELSKLGKNTNFDRWSKADCANWIVWLEKQGEQKCNIDINVIYDWLRQNAQRFINGEYNEFHHCYEYDGTFDTDKLIEHLKSDCRNLWHKDTTEENIRTLLWQKLVCCMDECCFSDEEWQWLVDNVKPNYLP